MNIKHNIISILAHSHCEIISSLIKKKIFHWLLLNSMQRFHWNRSIFHWYILQSNAPHSHPIHIHRMNHSDSNFSFLSQFHLRQTGDKSSKIDILKLIGLAAAACLHYILSHLIIICLIFGIHSSIFVSGMWRVFFILLLLLFIRLFVLTRHIISWYKQ